MKKSGRLLFFCLWILLSFWLQLGATQPAPRRIISLSPALTEIVAALGAADQLVGRTRYCTHPSGIQDRVTVVGDLQLTMEKILALAPDLILIQKGFHRKAAADLAGFGLVVHPVPLDSLADLFQAYLDLGERLGQPERGKKLLLEQQQILGRIESRVRRQGRATPVPIAILIQPRPLMAVGGGNFLADLFDRCGTKNVFGEFQGFFPTNREALLRRSPRVIFLIFWRPEGHERLESDPTEDLFSIDSEGNPPRVHRLDPDAVARPGPRLLAAASRICDLLYPDVR